MFDNEPLFVASDGNGKWKLYQVLPCRSIVGEINVTIGIFTNKDSADKLAKLWNDRDKFENNSSK